MRTTRALAIGAALAGLAVAGCGTATTSKPHAHPTAVVKVATVSTAQLAINRAVTAECLDAQAIDTSITAASTVGDFANGVSGWEAQLTAAGHIPMTGVPQGPNPARVIQLDYAEANLALFLASEHDNPFGPHFSKGKVSRGYNTATSKLQDVLNRCAAAGQPTS